MGFVYDYVIGKVKEEDVVNGIQARVKYIYESMYQFAHADHAGFTSLEFVQHSEEHPGMYQYFVKANYGKPVERIHERLTKCLKEFFEKVPTFDPIQYNLDYFLPNYDIKHFVEKYVGVNSWKHKAMTGTVNLENCFKDKKRSKDVPAWGEITMQDKRKYTSRKDGGSYE